MHSVRAVSDFTNPCAMMMALDLDGDTEQKVLRYSASRQLPNAGRELGEEPSRVVTWTGSSHVFTATWPEGANSLDNRSQLEQFRVGIAYLLHPICFTLFASQNPHPVANPLWPWNSALKPVWAASYQGYQSPSIV